MILDLIFPVQGEALPTDHAYPLYSALTQIVPAVHCATAGIRFAPISGSPSERGRLQMTPGSRLRVRLPQERIGEVLSLAGKRLDVDGHGIRLGVPSVTVLEPAAVLAARLVVIKGSGRGNKARRVRYMEVDSFREAARGRLTALGIGGRLSVPVKADGSRAGEPVRRVLRIKGHVIVGFSVVVEELTADESMRLQEHGLGGRTRLGCGFFLPVRG